jgi:hypothetical protein
MRNSMSTPVRLDFLGGIAFLRVAVPCPDDAMRASSIRRD